MPPRVLEFASLEALGAAAAGLFAGLARRAVDAAGWFTVALSGGSTPRALYRALATPAFAGRVPWERVLCFWSDERLVPPDHPESNFRLAREELLSRVPLPPRNIFPAPTADGSAKAAADSYQRTLRRQFPAGPASPGAPSPTVAIPRFDLVLLGLGADGHTASLFPGSPVLQERSRLVSAARAPEGYPTRERITLTLPVLNNAAAVIFLAAGPEKAPVIGEILKRSRASLGALSRRPGAPARWGTELADRLRPLSP